MAWLFKLWIKEVVGYKNIPSKGPALFVSNHLSYYDFLILSAVVPSYVVFLAQKKIKETFFVRWFTRFNNVIYIDREKPGYSFFKEILKWLEAGRLFVIYPEGTRSRTGKMLMPKPGFVKLAMKANVPIIPVALKGTYEILPPHKHIPRLKKCEVIIGKKMYISPDNPDLKDIFFKNAGFRKFGKLDEEDMQKIAVRIMDKIRILAGEEWDDSAAAEIAKISRMRYNLEFKPALQT
jgi:1-acyl-sn-glycerol-3-phosphate acyltransferase